MPKLKKFPSLKISRIVRTQGSDLFYIFDGKTRIGRLHVHYSKCATAELFLDNYLDKNYCDGLYDFAHQLISDIEVDDIIFNAYVGAEVYASSLPKDWSQEPVTSREFKILADDVKRSSGRFNTAVGKLIEKATIDYFTAEKFQCRSATDKEEESKIDVVAVKDDETLLIQCKAGVLSYRKICSHINKMKSFYEYKDKNVSVAFVCRSFPRELILDLRNIESRFSTKIFIINVLDIVNEHPEYKFIT